MTDAPAAPSQPRTAIVTGGARGIGAAVAARLSADGLYVAVLDLDEAGAKATAARITGSGGKAIGIAADVSGEDSVRAAVEQVAAELGPPVVVVNNAGVTRDNLIFKMTTADWDTVMNVHLRGAFLVTKAAQGHMVAARHGRIVNVSSTSALGNRGQVNYSAAKAGLQGFTKTLAVELGKFGITANSVAPGFVETEMTRATAERMGLSFDEHVKRSIEKIPVGRVGQPEDIAHVVSFFVSEGAGYVTGQVIYAAGGPRALRGPATATRRKPPAGYGCRRRHSRVGRSAAPCETRGVLLAARKPLTETVPTCCPAVNEEPGARMSQLKVMCVPEAARPVSARAVTTGTSVLLHGTRMRPTTVPAGSTVT
jgi:3-oxoacyl-[acyl-carrier protein] reductase